MINYSQLLTYLFSEMNTLHLAPLLLQIRRSPSRFPRFRPVYSANECKTAHSGKSNYILHSFDFHSFAPSVRWFYIISFLHFLLVVPFPSSFLFTSFILPFYLSLYLHYFHFSYIFHSFLYIFELKEYLSFFFEN